MEYAWIGIRKSDIIYSKLIKHSITTYGDGKNGNYSYCIEKGERVVKRGTESEISFIKDKINFLLDTYSKIKFILYDQSEMPYFNEYKDSFVCLNHSGLINILDSKIQAKIWLEKITNIIPFSVLPLQLINIGCIEKMFPGVCSWILQSEYGHSGNNTFVVEQEKDIHDIKQKYEKYMPFVITPQIKDCISVNQHIIISSNDIAVLQLSEQTFQDSEYTQYNGNAFSKCISSYDSEVNEESYRIAKIMQKIGYLGIIGIDYLIKGNNIFTIEINPRLQGSSVVFNRLLAQKSIPTLEDLWINISKTHDLTQYQRIERMEAVLEYCDCSNKTPLLSTDFCDGIVLKYSKTHRTAYGYKKIITENKTYYF